MASLEPYFERLLNGPPFQHGEDMTFDLIRLKSFDKWPDWSPSHPIHLAKAGFYHTGVGDECKCFKCGTTKSNWKSDDKPFNIHKLLNPNCAFLQSVSAESENSSLNNGFAHNNIPVFVEGLHNISIVSGASGSYIAQSSDGSSTGPGGTQESLENLPVSVGVAQGLTVSDSHHNLSLLSQNIGSVASATVQDYRPHQNDLVPKGPRVVGHSNTGTTLRPERVHLLRENLSESGTAEESRMSGNDPSSQGYDIPPPTGEQLGVLRYERNRLETFRNWPSTVGVSAVDLAKTGFHYNGSGDRVQCIFCRGILRNWDPGDMPHVEHRKHFPRCPFLLGIDVGNVPLPPSQTPAPPNRSAVFVNDNVTMTGMEALGINTERPKHAQYAVEATRIGTFQNWPSYKFQTPLQLAKAGFYFAGFGDNVKCFFCDGGLRNWEPGDDPWVEHAHWFPRCPYLKQSKGEAFIKDVHKQLKGGTGKIPEAATAGGQYRVEPREVRARLDRPYVQAVLGTGFSREIVLQVIQQRLETTGDDFPSASALMDAVLAMQDSSPSPDETQTKQPASTSNEGQSEVPVPGTSKGSSNKAGGGDMTTLKKEIQQLKEQRICKICMDEEVSVVFLPCGHLVCCVNCAPAMRNCPICRGLVKGTVRSYIA